MFNEMIARATQAANVAGAEWMANAKPKYEVIQHGKVIDTMLDLCGNAHVQFKDKRSAFYKAFKKDGFVRQSGNAVVEIDHDYKFNQEHGLKMACANAAKASLEADGITGLRIWQYID